MHSHKCVSRSLFLTRNRYWDQYYPGGAYDALARRKADATNGSRSSLNSLKSNPTKKASDTDLSKAPAKTAKVAPRAVANVPTPPEIPTKMDLETEYQKIIGELTGQVAELNGALEQATKEREFYFNKLREIEVYVQSTMDGGVDTVTAVHLKAVQDVLYKTEDGFEIPEVDE